MKTTIYDLSLFWSLFNSNGVMTIYAFHTFIACSRRLFNSLPDGTSFIYMGSEWVKRNGKVEKYHG